ncbi:MAG: S8/S53 family peptidase [Bradyrhizobium sp.]|nr:S8/S53 family peptidase [Bradyrhizobium sp.]
MTLATEALGRLSDDPDHVFVVIVGVKQGQEASVIKSLGIRRSETVPEFGLIFVKVTGSDVLAWRDDDDVEFVDVLDDREAQVVYHLIAQLHRIGFYDNIQVFQFGVLNLSIGPPHSLIGKDASGERAVQRVLRLILDRHNIPIVLAVGNSGPEPGLTNRWAVPGVLLAAATNYAGTELWARSSRFLSPMPPGMTMFGTPGIDTIGPRAGCAPKTKEELEAEERANLASQVGQENAACYELASGTSFAAGILSRDVCLVHQAMNLLTLKLSSLTDVDVNISVPPFIRAYIDSTFDRGHPAFANRLADTRRHFGALQVRLSAAEKQDAWDMLVAPAVNISVRYSAKAVRAFLVRASAPVSGLSREQIGEGFLSPAGIKAMLLKLRYADLVDVLGEGVPQKRVWADRIRQTRNPLVFSEQQVDNIAEYCANYDLILGLPLYGRS